MVSYTTQNKTRTNKNKRGNNFKRKNDYRELDLTQVSGMEVFLESVEDIQSVVIPYLSKGRLENYQSLDLADVSGGEIVSVFADKAGKLKESIAKEKNNLTQSSSQLSDSVIEEMQLLYDDLIMLRNHIESVYKSSKSKPAKGMPASRVARGQSSKEQDNKLKKTDSPFEKVKEADSSSDTTTDTESQGPSEVEISNLMKSVFENQFLVPEEREEAFGLYEKLHHSLASSEESDETNVIFGQLQALVDKFKNDPDPHLLVKRATRIIDHVSATDETPSQTLLTAMDLFEEVKAAELNQAADGKALFKAYLVLADFARKHETEWLSVCGVRIPVAGPESVGQAKKMREILMVEKDKHPALRASPKKQILVDRLMRYLENIPDSGLDERKDIPELIKLTHLIDVPRAEYLSEEEKQNSKNELEEIVYSLTPRRKTMEVSQEDNVEDLVIEVAEKTKETIVLEQEEAQVSKQNNEGPKAINHVLVSSRYNKDELSVVAEVENQDPINDVVQEKVFSPNISKFAQKIDSDQEAQQMDYRYRMYIQQNYRSFKAFSNLLANTVAQIESSSLDAFERWLGEKYESAFSYMKNMTSKEIEDLATSSSVRDKMSGENIKYEAFLTWLDLLPEMKQVVRPHEDMTLEELFASWIIESNINAQREAGPDD